MQAGSAANALVRVRPKGCALPEPHNQNLLLALPEPSYGCHAAASPRGPAQTLPLALTLSLKVLPALKAGTTAGGTSSISCVRGLRARRAARCRGEKAPNLRWQ